MRRSLTIRGRRGRTSAQLVRSGLVVVGAWMALTTSQRVSVWSDEERLWVEAVQHSPEKLRPWVNLGNMYALHGQTLRAEQAYREAIRRAGNPARSHIEQETGRALAQANLARLYWLAGDRAGAEALMREAVQSKVWSVVALERRWRQRQSTTP